jgi:hypothetical protein
VSPSIPPYILVTDGCFYGYGGMFRVSPPLELKKLEALFRHLLSIPRSGARFRRRPDWRFLLTVCLEKVR